MRNLFWQPGMTLVELEREAVQASLQFFHGNTQSAATALGIPEAEIKKKIEAYEQHKRDTAERDYIQRKERELFNRRQRGIQDDGTIAGQIVPNYNEAPKPGMGLQSPAQAPTQQPVSMPVGKKVQGVSPQVAPRTRSTKNR